MRRLSLQAYLDLKAGFRRMVERAGTTVGLGENPVMRGTQSDYSRWGSANDEHVVETPRFAPVDVVADLLVETGDVTLLDTLCLLVGHRAVPLPASIAHGEPLAKVSGQAMKETGDVFRGLGELLDDGVISQIESRNLGKEVDEAIVKLMALKLQVAAAIQEKRGGARE